MGKGVVALNEWYKTQGAAVTCHIYEGVRHEYLNDTSALTARNHISEFVISLA